MPLKLGGTTLSKVTYNGVELTKVIYNGTNVYEVASSAVYYGFGNDNNIYKYSLDLGTLLATGTDSGVLAIYRQVQSITSDANHLYIFSNVTRRIHKILKTLPSFPAEQVAETGNTLSFGGAPFMFIDGTDLYTVQFFFNRLSRYSTSTLAVLQSGSSSFADDILEILVDSSWVYAITDGRSFISRIPKNNLSGTINTLSMSAPGTFTQDATHIYAIRTNGSTFYRILKSNFTLVNSVSTGFSTTILIDENEMCAVDSNNFYFIVGSSGTNRLIRTTLTGGTVTKSTFIFPTAPRKIKLTADKIYVACQDRRIVVFDKSNIDSGTSFTLANPNVTADIVGFHIEEV
jgi:hypothetical protein